jgi:hypothetical protein
MAGRVLNFSEFFDKYSKDDADTEKGLDAITQSASNFETGFDDETYDQDQLGPNRPVSGGMEMTPPQPGEGSAPIATEFDSEMASEEVEEAPEATEETEETDVDETEEEEDEAEEAEEGNPEVGEKNESRQYLISFSKFITEKYDWQEEEENPFAEGEEEDTCPECGEYYEMGANPGEVSCGCNM